MRQLSGVQKFFIYLTALFLILDNGTIYTHLPGLSIIDAFVTFFPIVSLTLLALSSLKKFLSGSSFMVLVMLDLYIIFYLFISTSNEIVSLLTLILFNLLLIYYIMYERRNFPHLLIAYRNVITIIAAVSLFFWTFGSILQFIQPTGTVISTWGQETKMDPFLSNYYWMYFAGDEGFFLGGWIIDNRSIFTERAFAAYSFMIGLIYELFLEEKKSKYRIIILFTAVLSTTSTSGVIAAIIAFYLYLQRKVGSKKYLRIFYFLIVPAMLVFVYYLIDHLLQSRASMGHSTQSRTDDLVNGIASWLESPLYGYGFANNDKLAKLGTGYSNSITQILNQGGLMLALLYIVSFGRSMLRSVHQKDMEMISFLISFLVFFLSTGIATRNTILYMMIFFCMGYSNRKKCKLIQ